MTPQLARPGSQVRDAIARVELELAGRDRDGLGRIAGPPAVIRVGHACELLGERMQHAADDRCGPGHRK